VEETGLLGHYPKLRTGIFAEALESRQYNIRIPFPAKGANYARAVFCQANIVDANWFYDKAKQR
jgi:hypothetical protein